MKYRMILEAIDEAALAEVFNNYRDYASELPLHVKELVCDVCNANIKKPAFSVNFMPTSAVFESFIEDIRNQGKLDSKINELCELLKDKYPIDTVELQRLLDSKQLKYKMHTARLRPHGHGYRKAQILNLYPIEINEYQPNVSFYMARNANDGGKSYMLSVYVNTIDTRFVLADRAGSLEEVVSLIYKFETVTYGKILDTAVKHIGAALRQRLNYNLASTLTSILTQEGFDRLRKELGGER